nr:MAG TPA: hypothetical protein [Caudoviricetes sp.]
MLAHFAVVWHRGTWYDSIIENCVKPFMGEILWVAFFMPKRRWS